MNLLNELFGGAFPAARCHPIMAKAAKNHGPRFVEALWRAVERPDSRQKAWAGAIVLVWFTLSSCTQRPGPGADAFLKDLVEAYKWIALAADQGYIGASERLKAVAQSMTPRQIQQAQKPVPAK